MRSQPACGVQAFTVGEAGHGPGAAAHFAKGAFDDVGGAHFLPVRCGEREEMQQGVQIAFHASHRLGAAVFPLLLPGAKRALRSGSKRDRLRRLRPRRSLLSLALYRRCCAACLPQAGLCAQQSCTGIRGNTNPTRRRLNLQVLLYHWKIQRRSVLRELDEHP